MSKVFFYQFDPLRFEISFSTYIKKIYPFGDIEIRFNNIDTMHFIDSLLWRKPDISFLPHDIIENESTNSPIILSLKKIRNKKFSSLVLLESSHLDLNEIKEYERIAIFFEKNNINDLDNSRKLWKELKSNNFTTKFFEQKNSTWVEIN